MRRVVGGERLGPQKRHLAAARARNLGRQLVIGRKNQPIEHTRLARRIDRVRDERFTAEHPGVLPRNAFRARPCGDDSEYSHSTGPTRKSSH